MAKILSLNYSWGLKNEVWEFYNTLWNECICIINYGSRLELQLRSINDNYQNLRLYTSVAKPSVFGRYINGNVILRLTEAIPSRYSNDLLI